jgi:hypothetical protein
MRQPIHTADLIRSGDPGGQLSGVQRSFTSGKLIQDDDGRDLMRSGKLDGGRRAK